MKYRLLAQAVALTFVVGAASAQEAAQKVERLEITGSSIKRIQEEGALPVQVITREDQAQIYEELVRDASGRFTTSFVRRDEILKDNRLLPASQTAAFFHGHVAYDDTYMGTADHVEEGERLASVVGDKHVLFMKNHGVLVTGDSVAQAYRRLYKLERVCRAQVLAMSTGKPLEVLSEDIVAQVQAPAANDRHSSAERDRLFFEAMMRILDREMPGYAE